MDGETVEMNNSRPNYDATFCGKLPLHQTNLIQPHGVMLLFTGPNWEIIQVSENIAAIIDEPISQLIGQSLQAYLTESSIDNLAQLLQTSFEDKLPLTLEWQGSAGNQPLSSLIHRKHDYYVVEAQLASYVDSSTHSFADRYQQWKHAISAMERAASIKELCENAVVQIKQLSGFDKVMIYTFDEEWNGTVVAEALEEGMDRYLGLKFPASDIPKPARDMYKKNPSRIIPNRDYTPVRLYPVLNPLTHAFSDLTDADLRSVAAVHVEYLANMGVMASMSTRIIHEDRLWGLISCHHRTAKYLSYEMASVFELLSNVLSAKITSLVFRESFEAKAQLNQTYTQVVEEVYRQQSILSAFMAHDDIFRQLLSADGVALSRNGRLELSGLTPDRTEIESLIYWLQSSQTAKTYHQPALSQAFEEASSYSDKASGLLALPIQPERGHYILAFRAEVLRKVDWGGDPHMAVTFEKNNTVYHPRHSFSLYQETVRHMAIPWTEIEQGAAENLRNFLVEYTLNQLS